MTDEKRLEEQTERAQGYLMGGDATLKPDERDEWLRAFLTHIEMQDKFLALWKEEEADWIAERDSLKQERDTLQTKLDIVSKSYLALFDELASAESVRTEARKLANLMRAQVFNSEGLDRKKIRALEWIGKRIMEVYENPEGQTQESQPDREEE